jgi:hypothetical protein
VSTPFGSFSLATPASRNFSNCRITIWVVYSYSSANLDMANAFRKIIFDVSSSLLLLAFVSLKRRSLCLDKERGKNSALTKQVAKLEESLKGLHTGTMAD